MPDSAQWHYGQKVYAVLGTGTNGFAMVKRLERTPPAGEPAAAASINWTSSKGEVHIQWPGLDRYYMNEGQAPSAETAYRSHTQRTNQTCYVSVRVRGTHAVLENLFIDNQPIHAWLQAHPMPK